MKGIPLINIILITHKYRHLCDDFKCTKTKFLYQKRWVKSLSLVVVGKGEEVDVEVEEVESTRKAIKAKCLEIENRCK